MNQHLCIFCERSCSGKSKSKEHLFGKFQQRLINYAPNPKGKSSKFENVFVGNGKSIVEIKNSGHPMNRTFGNIVCSACNNGWMSQIDDAVRDIFASLYNSNLFLSLNDARALEKWAFLKAIIYSASYPIQSWTPDSAELKILDLRAEDFSEIEGARAKDFANGATVPETWQANLFLTQYRPAAFGAINYVPWIMFKIGENDSFEIKKDFIFMQGFGSFFFSCVKFH